MKIKDLLKLILCIVKSISIVIVVVLLGISLTVGEFFFSKINEAVYQQVIQKSLQKKSYVAAVLFSAEPNKWVDDFRPTFFWSSASNDVGFVRTNGKAYVLEDICIPTLFTENRNLYYKALHRWDDYLDWYIEKKYTADRVVQIARWRDALAAWQAQD